MAISKKHKVIAQVISSPCSPIMVQTMEQLHTLQEVEKILNTNKLVKQ